MIQITQEDNMALMARYPNNYFDLAFPDAGYGIGAAKPSIKPNKAKQKNGKISDVKCNRYKHKDWDDKPAGLKYGNEVFRVSLNYCIWGANYFDWCVGETFTTPRRTEYKQFVEKNPKGWIIWDKVNGNSDQMDCELLKTSFDFNTVIIKYMWAGMRQGSYLDGEVMEGNKKLNEKRFHPCHKPVRIYDLVFNFLMAKGFVKKADKILDTNIGAGSISLSCYNNGLDLVACDIEKEYCDISNMRFVIHQQQQTLF